MTPRHTHPQPVLRVESNWRESFGAAVIVATVILFGLIAKPVTHGLERIPPNLVQALSLD